MASQWLDVASGEGHRRQSRGYDGSAHARTLPGYDRSDRTRRWAGHELREDALDVLGDVTGWRLSESRWVGVTSVLESLRAALASGDDEGVRSAVYELELAGPVRGRWGEEPDVEPSPAVHRLIGILVDAVIGADAPETHGEDDA